MRYVSATCRLLFTTLFLSLSLCLAACAGDESEPAASPSTDSPAILTAYLGVLDTPALGAALLGGVSGCEQQPLDEGMPVVLSHRVDGATLDPSDFVVTTVAGAAMTPTCATLEPATDDDELQTVLSLIHI